MGLQIKSVGRKNNLIISLIAVFALVFQPVSGLVASQVANAISSPELNSIAFSTMSIAKGSTYNGIVVDYRSSGFTDATSLKVTIHRENAPDVSRAGTLAAANILNNGGEKLTVPFNFAGSTSSTYWGPLDSTWTKETRPTGVTVEVATTSHGLVTHKTGEGQNLVERNGTYESIVPVYPTFTLRTGGKEISNGDFVNPNRAALGDSAFRFEKSVATDSLVVNGTTVNNPSRTGNFGYAIRGEGPFTIYAKNSAGYRSETLAFTVDSVAPQASIEVTPTPEAGEPYRNPIVVTGVVDSSEPNIKSHWFEITNPDGSLSYSHNLNTDELTYTFNLDTSKGNGDYRLRYVATDKATNRSDVNGSTVKTITVNNTPFGIYVPQEKSYIKGSNHRIDINISNPKSVTGGFLMLNKTPGSNASRTNIPLQKDEGTGKWYAVVNTTNLVKHSERNSGGQHQGDGKYLFKVEVHGVNTPHGYYGNGSAWSNSEDFYFIVDNTAPVITVKDNFVGDEAVNIFSNISFALSDNIMSDKYVLNEGKSYEYVSDFTDNRWSDANFQNTKAHLVEGENTITLYDKAGNSSSHTFTYDSKTPVVNFATVPPEVLNPTTYKFDLTATDEVSDGSGVGNWSLIFLDGDKDMRIGRVPCSPQTRGNNATATCFADADLDKFETGKTYTARAIATDRAGNRGTVDHTFTADVTAPTLLYINRTSPQITNNSELTFLVRFSEDIANISGANFELVGSDATGTISDAVRKDTSYPDSSRYYVDVTGISGDGELKLRVKADETEDAAGNTLIGRVVGQWYIIDNTAPVVNFSDDFVGENLTFRGQVSIDASIHDVNLSHYYLSIWLDGTRYNAPDIWNTVSTSEFENRTLAILTADGPYRVLLEAKDKAGNKDENSTREIFFTIDNSPELDATYFVAHEDHMGVGFTVDYLSDDATSVTVELLDSDGNTIATNIGDTDAMRELLNKNPEEISSPFFLDEEGWSDEYWRLASAVDWATVNRPTKARITLNYGDGSSKTAEVALTDTGLGHSFEALRAQFIQDRADRLAAEEAERVAEEARRAQERQDELDRIAREQAERERLAREAAAAQAERDRLAREAADQTTPPITPLATAFPAGDTVIDDATVETETDEDEDGEVAAATTDEREEGDVLAAEDVKDSWSLINLLLTIGIGVASIISLLGLLGSSRKDRKLASRLLTIVPAAGAVVALLLIEDFSGSMIWVNVWSLLVGALAVIQMIILGMSKPATNE